MAKFPVPALFLVRHADAGDRTRYVGDDLRRPLSPEGVRQAEALALRLGKAKLATLVSSPARRCIETLEPLAKVSGLELEELDALVEGADPLLGLTKLLASGPRPDAAIVACSHGDVLGGIVESLLDAGLPYEGKARLPKGVTVEIALSKAGAPAQLRFVRPG